MISVELGTEAEKTVCESSSVEVTLGQMKGKIKILSPLSHLPVVTNSTFLLPKNTIYVNED